MQNREVVAAVVAGDPDGLAAAYDQFAGPLYAYCHLMLPDPDVAADVVRDTFLIATSRLEGLTDPGRLGAWLHAVARNECLRRLSAAGITPPPPRVPWSGESGGALAGIGLPARLRGQVIKACTDTTPAGRAQRVSAAHRAGSFGPAGFPKTIGSPGPPWWRRVRRHPRAAAAAAATVAAVAAAAGIIVLLTAGAPHRAQATIVALGGGIPSDSASGADPSPAASHRASAANGQPKPPVTAPGSVPSQHPPAARGTQLPSAPASSLSASYSPSPSPSSSPSPSPSSSSSPSPSPSQGTLRVVPTYLTLTSIQGKAVSGTFIVSAVGGPVSHYAISVPGGPAGKVTVSSAQGSLAAGQWVTVTVTVTSKVAINATIVVDPGPIAVTVALTVKA